MTIVKNVTIWKEETRIPLIRDQLVAKENELKNRYPDFDFSLEIVQVGVSHRTFNNMETADEWATLVLGIGAKSSVNEIIEP